MQGSGDRNRKEEKRAQAILELYKSEQEYIYDLSLWSRTYRQLVTNTPNLSVSSKQLFKEHIQINIGAIFSIHTKIFEKICAIAEIDKDIKKEEILSADISSDQIEKICAAFIERNDQLLREYTEYASRLPKAIKDMEILTSTNEEFNQESMNLLQKMNRLHLGCSHFIMRPMQKITRYPLLFHAMQKKCRESESEALNNTIEEIKKIDEQVNRNVKYSTNYFSLYHLIHSMDIKINNSRISVGFMQKERKLLRQEEEVKLVLGVKKKLVTVVILDNCMFLVQDVVQIQKKTEFNIYEKRLFGDFMPLHMLSVEKIQNEKTTDVFMIEINYTDQKYLLETSEWIIDGIYQDIIEAQKEERKRFIDIKIEKVQIDSKGTEVSIDIIDPKKCEKLSLSQIGMLLIGCNTCFEIVTEKERKTIMDQETYRVKYVPTFNGVLFLRRRDLYYLPLTNIEIDSNANINTNSNVKPKKVTSSIFTFFFSINNFLSETQEMENILSVKKLGYLGSEELLISKFSINTQGSIVKKLYRRMYMAGDITNLIFFGSNIAVASNDFELINLNDLTTQELLDPLDKTISIYVNKNESKPIDIIKTEKNTYLVAFANIGFFINQYGSRKKTYILFLWLMQIHSISLYKKYVIAIGENNAKIFTLDDGLLRGVLNIRKGKFLPHPDYLLIYNDQYLYRISI